MILVPSRASSLLTTTSVNNGLRASTISLSGGATGTPNGEKQSVHLNSPTSVGIIAERLVEVEPEKERL